MLSADTELDVRSGSSSEFGAHLDQLSYADLIQLSERIGLEYLLLIVVV